MRRGITEAFDSVGHIRDGDTSAKFSDEAIARVGGIFKRFDVNGDGYISHDELASVFQHVDPDHWNTDNVFCCMRWKVVLLLILQNCIVA